MKYRWTEKSKTELAEAVEYYNFQRPGLGYEFAVQLGIGISKVLDAPRSWLEIDRGIRRHLIDRFPYALVYHLPHPNVVEIISVFHLHRKPESWRQNLT
jgi:hypothetical protein